MHSPSRFKNQHKKGGSRITNGASRRRGEAQEKIPKKYIQSSKLPPQKYTHKERSSRQDDDDQSYSRVADRALRGRPNQTRILCKSPPPVFGLWGLPPCFALFNLFFRDDEFYPTALRVDLDLVAVAHEGDGSAHLGLRGNVTNHEPARGSGEPPVGHESNLVAQPLPNERGGDLEHLPHPRPSPWPLVSYHDDVAGDDLSPRDRFERELLPVKDLGAPPELCKLQAGNLHHRPLRCERPAEYHVRPLRPDRRLDQLDDVLSLEELHPPQVLPEVLACDRESPAVEHPLPEELMHDQRDSPHLVKVKHHVLATGSKVRYVGHLPPQPFKIVQRELHADLLRESYQVHDRVRRAAYRLEHCDRIFKRLKGKNVPRL